MYSSNPRFALFGNFGTGNLGNDGSLESMLLTFRRLRPDAELTCICPNPVSVANMYRVRSVSVTWRRPAGAWFNVLNRLFLKLPGKLADAMHALNLTREFDVIIMPGTGLIGSVGEPAFGWPYALFIWCFAAKLHRKHILIVSTGAGPLPNPIGRWLMLSAADMADYRSFRDGVSRDRLTRYGLQARNDPVYPDIAFSLPAPAATIKPGGKIMTVGVGLMAYHGWRSTTRERAAVYESYIAAMKVFVSWLLEQGHMVRLIIGEETDQHAVKDVCAAMIARGGDCGRRVISEPAGSLHDVMRQMAETDIVIATRFHNIISALMVGRPAISLGYSEPHDALMAEMGLGAYCQHVERIDVELLIAQFTRLTEARGEHQLRIQEMSCRYRALLAQQDAVLAGRFFG